MTPPDDELAAFHLFRRMPDLVRGGTILGATADDDGHVRWLGSDGARHAIDLETKEITTEAPEAEPDADAGAAAATALAAAAETVASSDGKLLATVTGHNITLTVTATGEKRSLTRDGTADHPWSAALFTCDDRKLLVAQGDVTDQVTNPLVDWLSFPCNVTDVPSNAEAAPALPPPRLALLDLDSAELTRVDERGRCDLIPRWASPDGKHVLAMSWDRTNTIELVRIDATTGAITALMTDRVVNTVPYLYICLAASSVRIPDFDGMIWASDRDGDLRLYAVPTDGSDPWPITPAGVQVSQPTSHLMPMTIISAGDSIALIAHTDPSRPYDVHACTTNLAGDFRVVSTDAGVHAIAPVSGADVFLDVHSNFTRAPRTDLYRYDGTLVTTLDVADVSEAEAAGRIIPEEFTVKAADGTTDLHGLLFTPVNFDPTQSYPLIDVVYGGPQQVTQTLTYVSPYASNSPWTDWAGLAAAFTRLGFVGIVLDGRGTPGRGRAFQEAAGIDFPNITASDHAAAIRALAAERPWIDASRCGALGHSFGGYHAVRCALGAPEIFKAAVSAAGAFEPALQDRTFAEGLLGVTYQDDPDAYADAGCSAHAKELEAELLIVAGTHDTNVHLSHAMQFSEALTQAGKHHDLVILQGKDHTLNGFHGEHSIERAARFLCQHLRP